MPMVRASGGADHIRLDLYGYASGTAEARAELGSRGSCSGNGRYILKGVNVDRLVGISGSMSVTYTNGQGQTTTETLTQGNTISVGNSEDITISWSGLRTFRADGTASSSGSVSGSIIVDVYF